MPRRVGFNRNLFLDWLDAAAAFAAETDDPRELRRRLEPLVAQTIPSAENRRKAIDILVTIWLKSHHLAPPLHREALARFPAADAPPDRLWLHYGLTLLAYSFFRDTAAVGQLGRSGAPFTPAAIKQRLTASYGQIGSLGKAVERVLFSLRNWGLLVESEQHDRYQARIRGLIVADRGLEAWLLACALRAHESEELPLQDLPRLPELFPFRFSVTPADLRRDRRFVVERQGPAWESVRLAAPPLEHHPNRLITPA